VANNLGAKDNDWGAQEAKRQDQECLNNFLVSWEKEKRYPGKKRPRVVRISDETQDAEWPKGKGPRAKGEWKLWARSCKGRPWEVLWAESKTHLGEFIKPRGLMYSGVSDLAHLHIYGIIWSQTYSILRSHLSWKKGVRANLVRDAPWHPPNLTLRGHVQAYVSNLEACAWRFWTFMSMVASIHKAQEGTFCNKRFATVISFFRWYITVYFLLCWLKINHLRRCVGLFLNRTWPRTLNMQVL
jgi:hypothetical protein